MSFELFGSPMMCKNDPSRSPTFLAAGVSEYQSIGRCEMDIRDRGINISERVKRYRRENGLSQRSFGELMGITAQAVCKWEAGMCYPDITLLPQLARILGCSTDDFFYENAHDAEQ